MIDYSRILCFKLQAIFKTYMCMKHYIRTTHTYELLNSSVSFDTYNNAPYTYDYHTTKLQLLENNINTVNLTTYETHKSYYHEVIDLLIKDKLQIKHIT